MIEFKTKYTPGQWLFDGFDIGSEHGFIIDCDGIPLNDDVNLIVQAPQMAEYMMGRAKELHEEINMYYCSPSSWIDEDIKKDTINELKVILSTLKDAGIEVVEK